MKCICLMHANNAIQLSSTCTRERKPMWERESNNSHNATLNAPLLIYFVFNKKTVPLPSKAHCSKLTHPNCLTIQYQLTTAFSIIQQPRTTSVSGSPLLSGNIAITSPLPPFSRTDRYFCTPHTRISVAKYITIVPALGASCLRIRP